MNIKKLTKIGIITSHALCLSGTILLILSLIAKNTKGIVFGVILIIYAIKSIIKNRKNLQQWINSN